MILAYHFATGNTKYDSIQTETSTSSDPFSHTSHETISDWLKYCRAVCLVWGDEKFKGKIGGSGKTVEIDECKIGKRKYNRGRYKDGVWVLGIIEIQTDIERGERRGGEFRIVELKKDWNEKRNAATLLPYIRKHVELGTTIVTDRWAAYNDLQNQG